MRKRTALALLALVVGSIAVSAADQADPRKALEEARKFAQEGKYAEALEKHVWFHENALKIRPSLAGVRLSFALSDWIQLGEKYPKARAKLVEIRDADARSLRGGELKFETFLDFASINEYLKATRLTYELFKELHQVYPNFAAQCYGVAREAVMSEADYKLCRSYLKEPKSEFKEIAAQREHLLAFAEKQSEPSKGRLSEAADRRFTQDVRHLIDVLVAVGQTTEAEEIQNNASSVLKTEVIVNARADAKKKFGK